MIRTRFTSSRCPEPERLATQRHGRRAGIGFAALVALVGGCSGSPPDQPVGEIGQNLYQYPRGHTHSFEWLFNTVSVCFAQNAPSDEVQLFKDAINDTWAAAAPFTFRYYQGPSCPYSLRVNVTFNPTTWGPDYWKLAGAVSGSHGAYEMEIRYCNVAACQPGQPDRVDYVEGFRYTVAHEMGHALGFAHEQQRPDYPMIDCALDIPGDGQSDTLYGGTYLTQTRDPDSIMHYCRRQVGGVPVQYLRGDHNAEELSVGDQQGALELYNRRHRSSVAFVSL